MKRKPFLIRYVLRNKKSYPFYEKTDIILIYAKTLQSAYKRLHKVFDDDRRYIDITVTETLTLEK